MLCRSVLALMILALPAFSHGQSTSEGKIYLNGYEERAAYISAFYDTSRNGGFYSIAARYAHGRDIATADSMFIAAMKEPSGDMFWMFPVIGAYMHGKDRMSTATKAAVRHAWKTYMPYRGDTENHWAMYYASLYIAAEEWAGLPGSEWFNGRSSDENLEEAREYLIHWIKITTTIGQGSLIRRITSRSMQTR